VRLHALAGDPVELEQLGLELPCGDLIEIGHCRHSGPPASTRGSGGSISQRDPISGERRGDGFRASRAALRLRRARAAHRRADDARPPRQAPPGLRRQGERALDGTEWEDQPSSEVLRASTSCPATSEARAQQRGGHANHTLFWEIMSPDGGGEPSGDLAAAIDDAFGSLDDLKASVNDAGVNRFGSGWPGSSGTARARGQVDREPGLTPISAAGRRAAARHRRLGARLLPQVPRTGARTTWPRGGTSSTGTRSRGTTPRRKGASRGGCCWSRRRSRSRPGASPGRGRSRSPSRSRSRASCPRTASRRP
jgi:hypothetical protein